MKIKKRNETCLGDQIQHTYVLNIPFPPPYTTFQEKCSFSYIPISTINSRRIYKKTDNKKREFYLQSQIHAPVIPKNNKLKTTDATEEDEESKSYTILLL